MMHIGITVHGTITLYQYARTVIGVKAKGKAYSSTAVCCWCYAVLTHSLYCIIYENIGIWIALAVIRRLRTDDCSSATDILTGTVCGTFAGRSFIHIAVYSNRDIRALQYNSKVSIRHSDCDVRCMLYPLRSSSTITYALPLPAFDSSNDIIIQDRFR